MIVGGAGFVGSNLVVALMQSSPKEIVIVDNLLSAERLNVPDAQRVTFIEGAITDDNILATLTDD